MSSIDGVGSNWSCDSGDNLWRLDLTNSGKQDVTADIHLDGEAAHTVVVPAKGVSRWTYRVLDGTPDVDATRVEVVVGDSVVAGVTATDTCVAYQPVAASAQVTMTGTSVTVDPSGPVIVAVALIATLLSATLVRHRPRTRSV